MLKYEIYVKDIEEMIQRLERQLKKGRINFDKDVDSYDLIVLRLQVIGQAIKEIPKKILSQIPEVNWRIFVSFRNISSHNYGAINKEIFVRILKREIPILKKNIKKLKKVIHDEE